MPRRQQHTLSYYLEEIGKTADYYRINMLLDEAANQPEKILSHEDFIRIYWLAHDILRGEDE